MWCCPACGLQLVFDQGSWCCESNHNYDKAKEGYVNLQLAQERNSKAPGDNKEMIMARRAFLEKGFYDPLIERLVQLILTHSRANNVSLFDAGCGEGYYLEQIRSSLESAQVASVASGCDISKVAIQKAAKAHKKCEFAVASTFKIPVQTHSLDVVIQVFAPSSEQEIARILKPGGLWLLVNPGSSHLHQLKQAIYNETKQHSLTQLDTNNFSLQCRESVGFDMTFEHSEERLNLLKMTPFYWHASEQSKNQFLQSTTICQTEFDIQVLRKNHED